MDTMIMKMPAVALRGMVILPGMVAHFDVSRAKSIKAVEEVYCCIGSSHGQRPDGFSCGTERCGTGKS